MGTTMLTVEEVVRIHYILCKDFEKEDDPIGYGGVRSQSLLESAVGRQHAGFGPFRKYEKPVPNAATLTYGICNDHPFHNGNKRTALVSMLAHLDKNRLTLKGDVRQDELYDLMLSLARHDLTTAYVPTRKRSRPAAAAERSTSDHQVGELVKWLEARVTSVRRGERPITYRELPKILAPHGYELGRTLPGNQIEVVRRKESRGIIRREARIEKLVIGRIGYRNEGETVSMATMKQLRTLCRLREEDGVDSDAFYEGADIVAVFVNRYRTVLRRLAKT